MSRSPEQPEIEEILARARATWPDVEVDPSAFAEFLDERAADVPLDRLHLEDLYLACACVRGDATAIARVEEIYVRELRPSLATFERAGISIEDVVQTLRVRLFVGEEGSPGRIAAYGGISDLRTWIKVIAFRIAISLGRKYRRELPIGDEVLLESPEPAPSPELALIKETYRLEFRSAFEAAFQALEARERNILRHQVLDRLGIDQIGALYGVHRATAARWIAGARRALVAAVKRELQKRLQIGREELDSILRMVQSQIDVSLRVFLSAE